MSGPRSTTVKAPGQVGEPVAPPPDDRTVLLVAHTGRPDAVRMARQAAAALTANGIGVRVLDSDASELALRGAEVAEPGAGAADGCELVMVLGGDGTILRAAHVVRGAGIPLLGVNLGHIGFLAESERDDLDVTVEHVVRRAYHVEERMTVDVRVSVDGEVVSHEWALNEASVEKASRERMLEVVVEVDGRPLSRWGGDGVVAATPTGSTAYAFSAGGPIVWPAVEALLLVPLSAHALFARPLVVGPGSVLAVEILAASGSSGVLWCDGQRTERLRPGARVEVRRGAEPVRLARLHRGPFTDRLVAKFDLPVSGWRGRAGRSDPAARDARGGRGDAAGQGGPAVGGPVGAGGPARRGDSSGPVDPGGRQDPYGGAERAGGPGPAGSSDPPARKG